jgi:hypothetical protein
MRIRFTIRRLMLLVLAFGLGVAADELYRRRRRPPWPDARDWAVLETWTRAHRVPAGEGPVVASWAPGSIRMIRPGPMGVRGRGHAVAVTGEAEVHEINRNVVYMWSVRFYEEDPPRVLVRERDYPGRPFSVGAREVGTATFADTFRELPAGRYLVTLVLSAVPPGVDPAGLKPGELDEVTWEQGSSCAHVTVPEEPPDWSRIVR